MEDAPTLEVGFAIDTSGSFDSLTRLDGLIDRATANAVAEFAKVENASRGMLDLGGAIASIQAFGAAATREAATAARELGSVEKAGEAMVRQLERQNAAFGQTREQMRGVKAEAAALAAEQKGLTELAGRIRDQEAELYAKEFAAARQIRQEAEAAAEAKAVAAQQGVAAAEREAQALRSASFAYGAFEAAARRGMAAYREQQAVEAAAAQEAATLAARVERLREGIDPAYAAQKRMNLAIDEARALYGRGVISFDEYVGALRRAQRATSDSGNAVDEHGRAFNRMGASGMIAEHVVRSFSDSIASGQSPVRAFGMEAGRVGEALSLWAAQSGATEGAAGRLAGFMGGPWGIAITAGLAVLAPLVGKLFEGNEALDDAVRKLKAHAEEERVAEQAQDAFRGSVEGVAAAIRDQRKALDEQIASQQSAIARAYAQAEANEANAVAIRDTTRAQLEQALSQQRSLRQQALDEQRYGQSDRATFALGAADSQVAGLEARLADAISSLTTAQRNLADTHANYVAETAQQQIDPSGQLKRLYDQQVEAAKAAARASGDWAHEAQEVARIERERAAAMKALQDSQRAASGNTNREFGRTISSADASAIARAAGFQVNSADLTFASQKALYDRWVAQGRPASNPVARPGSSAHEFGNALDLQKTAGLTVQQIRDAFAAEGVRLTRIFSEQGHWHIEWARSAQDVRAVSDAHHDAAQAAREQLQFERDLAANAHAVIAPIGPSAVADQARRAAEEQRRVWHDLFGDEDPLGDTLRADAETRAARYEAQWAEQARQQKELQDQLKLTADLADSLGDSLARAFGQGGSAIGQVVRIVGHYGEEQNKIAVAVKEGQLSIGDGAKRSADLQITSLIGITDAAKGLFKEHSAGYEAMAAAEKALTIIQLARTAVDVAGGAARMFASLGPFGFPAVAAMLGVMASLGFGGSSSSSGYTAKSNTGTGTVLGDPSAKSDSIKNAVDALKEVDTLMLTSSRQMAASLRSIDAQISGFASQILKAGDISANAGVTQGFKTSAIGSVLSKIPLIGGLLGSLFGSTTTVTGSGLYGGAQSLGSILNGGFDASYYSDVQKKSKFLGITTSTKNYTQYSAADPALQSQFTLILRSFDDAIAAAAGPLGESTEAIQQRLNGFIVDIGKIDLSGLTGDQITEKLTAVFGAAADRMAAGAFPGIERFQKAGEGAFETLVRVSSTVESVTASLAELGAGAQSLGIDAKLGLAGQFDTLSDLTTAVDGYFTAFYTPAEQAAAKAAQLGKVFDSLGLAMPATLDAFRQLVDAQDLTTAAGQSTYATLLKLAPAFADLKSAMDGAKSAVDIASERSDLQRQLLELQGDTAALRELDLAKVDVSNRALQEQVWAVQDAQDAAKAAADLRDAWKSVGDSIMDEVNRIRGLSTTDGGGDFATLQGQFNAANDAARAGDQDIAKTLPGLSQALLTAAAAAATSRQELDRVQAQTAASLEATYGVISTLGTAPTTTAATVAAAATAAQAATPAAANDDMADELRALREEVAAMRTENTSGLAAVKGDTGRMARKLEDVTAQSGGDAIAIVQAA